jgi:hypothetical protein
MDKVNFIQVSDFYEKAKPKPVEDLFYLLGVLGVSKWRLVCWQAGDSAYVTRQIIGIQLGEI